MSYYDMTGAYMGLNPLGYGSYMGYNSLGANGLNPFSMTSSLYMMNFYNQLKSYYANAPVNTQNTAAGGNAQGNAADFQTTFQNAFRKALQETLGISDTAVASVSSTPSDSGLRGTTSRFGTSQRNRSVLTDSYNNHPSHIWTSSL